MKRLREIFADDGGLFRSVMAGVRWSLLFRISASAFAFLIAVLTARLLTVEGYGQLQFVMGVLNVVFLLGGLGLAKIVIRETAVAAGQKNWGVPRGILPFATLASLSATLLVGTLGYVLVVHPAQPDLTVLYVLGLAMFLLRQVQIPLNSFLNGLRWISLAGLGDFLRDLAIVLALGLVWLWMREGGAMPVDDHGGFDATGVMLIRLGGAALSLTVLAVLARRIAQRLPGDWTGTSQQVTPLPWLRAGLPLMLIGATSVLFTNADIMMLGLFAGPEQVGLYYAASRSQGLIDGAIAITVFPLMPLIAWYYSEARVAELRRLVTKTTIVSVAIALPSGLVLVVFAEPFLGLFGPEFLPAAPSMRILVTFIALTVLLGPSEYVLTMTGHQREAALIAVGAVTVNVLLNAALIPTYGIFGAALATGASLLLLKASLWYCARRMVWLSQK